MDPMNAIAKELLKRIGMVPPDVQPEKLPGVAVPVEARARAVCSNKTSNGTKN
jgi:hypothetical protein